MLQKRIMQGVHEEVPPAALLRVETGSSTPSLPVPSVSHAAPPTAPALPHLPQLATSDTDDDEEIISARPFKIEKSLTK